MPRSLAAQIELASRWIAASRHHVAFTGSGISADSGLPDFHGPDGVWTRRDLGLPAPPSGKRSEEVTPNEAHYALVELEQVGRLKFLISQNVDGLHLRSGFPLKRLAELHGNSHLMRCLGCERRFTLDEARWDRRRWGEGYRRQLVREGQPRCPRCAGRIISSVVNFGDPLPDREIAESIEHSLRADVFFAIGSSLLVAPANHMPLLALQHGAKLILLNRGGTPFDRVASLHIDAAIGEVLPALADRVIDLVGAERERRNDAHPH